MGVDDPADRQGGANKDPHRTSKTVDLIAASALSARGPAGPSGSGTVLNSTDTSSPPWRSPTRSLKPASRTWLRWSANPFQQPSIRAGVATSSLSVMDSSFRLTRRERPPFLDRGAADGCPLGDGIDGRGGRPTGQRQLRGGAHHGDPHPRAAGSAPAPGCTVWVAVSPCVPSFMDTMSSILLFRRAAIADWHCHERIGTGQCRRDRTPWDSR
jgi:hypothetical protein